ERIDQLKNFGYVDETTVGAPGINGKMSEVNAAMGLLQLDYIDQAIEKRRAIDAVYRRELQDVPGIHCVERKGAMFDNYAYFPILVGPQYPASRDALYDKLKANDIFARRYFYPLISSFPMYRGLSSAHRENLPIATQVSSQVLCLPIYPALALENQMQIIELIRGE
ncbi:MAG: DegT/DnrJ/EryC1/StrS family aminotransferase, partial [Pseudomonadales bacterium]